MTPTPQDLIGQGGGLPVRKSVRRLRWFKKTFSDQVRDVAARTGCELAIDDAALAAAFVEWLDRFDTYRPVRPELRRQFVGHAAGLMLEALIRHRPVEAISGQRDTDHTRPETFWPEGYCYVTFCLQVRSAVLAQDFHEPMHDGPALSDMRTWWSFRENVSEDPALSMGFLDLFAGDAPHWGGRGPFRQSRPGPAQATKDQR